MPPRPPPQGVGGWLLLFCIQVTLLAPLLTLGTVSSVVTQLASLALLDHPEALFVLSAQLPGVLVVLLGAWAGIQLWRVSPGAIRLVRVYLVALGALPLVTAALQALFWGRDGLGAFGAQFLSLASVYTIAGAAVWWMYFSNSRRVKATYSAKVLQAFD